MATAPASAPTANPPSSTSSRSPPVLGAIAIGPTSQVGLNKSSPTTPPIDTTTRVPEHSNPSVTLTPATPESALSHSVPSQPVPLESTSSPLSKDIHSGDGSLEPTKAETSPIVPAVTAAKMDEKTQTNSIPTTASSTTNSKPSPSAAASSSKPAASRTAPPAQKKKRKRKGFAGLLLAMGCLSAADFEDDEKTQKKREEMTQKSSTKPTVPTPAAAPASTSTPAGGTADKAVPSSSAAIPADKAVADVDPLAAVGATSGPSGTASTTLVESRDQETPVASSTAKPEEVIVAPVEPVNVPIDETAGLTSSAVQAPGSGSELLSTPHRPGAARRESESGPTTSAEKTETSGGYSGISESDTQDENGEPVADEQHDDYNLDDEYEDEEDRLIAQGGLGIPVDENGNPAPLLPVLDKAHHGRKCLVLDLDETLLHSSFKMLPSADFIVPVEIELQTHNVYVIKRPGVDHFLKEMGKIYEVVIFTASLSKYADPVLDMLDIHRVVKHRLFRESCYNHKGNYVKDLSQLGREMETVIILDNSPASYIFHPNNAVPVSTWFNDPHDTELTDLCPFLTDLATVEDIRGVLDGSL